MSSATVSITVKVPDEVHEALREWAAEEERSLHGQVVYLLRQATEERRRRHRRATKAAGEGQGDAR